VHSFSQVESKRPGSPGAPSAQSSAAGRERKASSPLTTRRGRATFQRRQATGKEQEAKRMPRGGGKVKKQKQKLQLSSTGRGGAKETASADRKANLHFVLEMPSDNPA